MHGVLRTYTLEARDVDEVVRRVTEGGIPILQSIPGFVSYAILDAGHGTLVTYSVYESETGTETSTQRAAAWVGEHIAPMLPRPPAVLAGEVRLRELAGEPRHGVIRRYQVDPRNMDRIVERAREGFLPLVRQLPGFATYSILDAGGGTLVTLSGFTTAAGVAESVRAAAGWVREHLPALVPDPPQVMSGEVRVRVTAARGQAAGGSSASA